MRRLADTVRRAWSVAPSADEIAAYAALALAAGAHVLLAVIRIQSHFGMDEQKEWLVFLWTCPLAVVAAAVAIALVHGLPARRDLAWTLGLLNAAGLAALVAWLFEAILRVGTWRTWGEVQSGLLVLSVAVAAAWPWLPAVVCRRIGSAAAVLFVALVTTFCLTLPLRDGAPDRALLAGAIVAAALMAVHHAVPRAPAERRGLRVVDLAVVLLVAIVTVQPDLPFNVHHADHYLGPVEAVVTGRHILVDVWCQYGVGVVSFLAGLFSARLFDLSGHGLSAIITVLVVLQCTLWYGLLVALLRSRLLAAVGLALLWIVVLCGTPTGPIAFPSIGPLRFGPPFALLGAFVGLARFPRGRWIAAAAVLGVGSLWSVETFLYCAAAFAALAVYEAGTERSWARDLARRLAEAVTAIAAFQLFFHVETRLTTGAWPDWGSYLDFLVAYSAIGGFSTLPVRPSEPWWMLLGIYLMSAVACGLARAGGVRERPPALVAGLAGLGVAMFTYFLGRSHFFNLDVVAPPALMLLLYWTRYFTVVEPVGGRALRTMLALAAYAPLALAVVAARPQALDHLRASLLDRLPAAGWNPAVVYRQSLHCAFDPCPDPSLRALADWIRRYEPDTPRTAVFFEPEVQTQTLLLLRRRHVVAVGHMAEDLYTLRGQTRLAQAPIALQPGDHVFYDVILDAPDARETTYRRAERTLLRRICEQFACTRIEDWQSFRVIVVEARPGLGSP